MHGGREKKAKKRCGGAEGVPAVLIRKPPGRGVVRAGVLEVDARTVRLSPLPLTWRFRKQEGLPILLGRPSSFVPPRGHISFTLLDRARPVCLRLESRRFAAVSLRHAPAGAVSFSSGRKPGPPPEPSEANPVGRGGAKEWSAAVAVRRLRSGTDFAPTKWGA